MQDQISTTTSLITMAEMMSQNSAVQLMGLGGEEGRLAQLERGPRAMHSRDSPKQTIRPRSPDLSLNHGNWDGW